MVMMGIAVYGEAGSKARSGGDLSICLRNLVADARHVGARARFSPTTNFDNFIPKQSKMHHLLRQ